MSEKVPTTTPTPTTRILAIGTINPGVDQAKVFEILPNEVRETVKKLCRTKKLRCLAK